MGRSAWVFANGTPWEDLPEQHRAEWLLRMERDLDIRDLYIEATNNEGWVLDDIILRIAERRYREEVCG